MYLFQSLLSDFHRRNQTLIFFNPSLSFAQTLRGVGHDDFIMIYTEPELNQFILCKILASS